MRLLIVGNDFDTLRRIEDKSRKEYPESDIKIFTEIAEAEKCAAEWVPDIAFVNVDQEAGSGKVLLKNIREKNSRANLIVMSKSGTYTAESLALYPSGYLITPITSQQIMIELHNLRYPIKGFKGILNKLFGKVKA